MTRSGSVASLFCCSILVSAASAAAAASAPDLSGAWARTTFELEAPASGPGFHTPVLRPHRVQYPSDLTRKSTHLRAVRAPCYRPPHSGWGIHELLRRVQARTH